MADGCANFFFSFFHFFFPCSSCSSPFPFFLFFPLSFPFAFSLIASRRLVLYALCCWSMAFRLPFVLLLKYHLIICLLLSIMLQCIQWQLAKWHSLTSNSKREQKQNKNDYEWKVKVKRAFSWNFQFFSPSFSLLSFRCCCWTTQMKKCKFLVPK